ncbi:MAG: DUF1572 family protein [Calditrichaeota bacterium]|nr:DUF1572 family protein [Calditrichota bacterium]
MKRDPSELFLSDGRFLLGEYFRQIEEAVERLDEFQVWARPNPASNSIGNLLLHLAGNIRQHIISGCGGVPDVRKRSSEFAAQEGANKNELLAALKQTVDEACETLATLDPSVLMETRVIQNKEAVVFVNTHHCIAHFAYHTGQIVMRVKEITAKRFGWYDYLEGT